MSLIGVVRHLTEVEASWVRVVLHGRDVADDWCTEQSQDGDFDDVTAEAASDDVATDEQGLARHLGHMDLLREAVDGCTGY